MYQANPSGIERYVSPSHLAFLNRAVKRIIADYTTADDLGATTSSEHED